MTAPTRWVQWSGPGTRWRRVKPIERIPGGWRVVEIDKWGYTIGHVRAVADGRLREQRP